MISYPYSRRTAASSLSPSAPFRCDAFPLVSFTPLIAFFEKSKLPNSAAKKMIDVIITMPVLCCKVSIDHGNIPRRGNILTIAALSDDIRHIKAYPRDLACSDRRMRLSHVLFVLLEVVRKHVQGILQAIDTRRVHARGYLCEFLKIKVQYKHFLMHGWNSLLFPFSTVDDLGLTDLIIFKVVKGCSVPELPLHGVTIR